MTRRAASRAGGSLLAAMRGKEKAATDGSEPTKLDLLRSAVRQRRLGDPMLDATDSYVSGTISMEEAALALADDIPDLRRGRRAGGGRPGAGRSRCEEDPALTVPDRLAA